MTFFRCDNLRAVTSGRWLKRPEDGVEPVGVGTDSRADLTGRIFIAIVGERFDGHDYVDAAASAGARLAIVQREIEVDVLPDGFGVLLVEETRRALAQLALAYRRTLSGTRVIAITGSCGKTTTKRMIDAVLATTWPGTAAVKSYNNDIGVPLTILDARPTDRYLIVEIGSNAPGEIAQLGHLAEPDIAVVTNVGRAHLGGFGSVEAVAREKGSLVACLRPHGAAVVNADVPWLVQCARSASTAITFGESDEADLRLTNRRGGGDRCCFQVNGRQRFELALPGRHNALNALAAVAVGRRFAVPDEKITAALAALQPEPMRMAIEVCGGVTVFNDAYNANPDSTAAALDAFIEAAAEATRRIVVLGDMLELGQEADALHQDLGRAVIDVDSRRTIHRAVFIGELARHAAEAVRRVWPSSRCTHLPELDGDAIDVLAALVKPGDAVLLKASRQLRFERIAEALRTRPAPRRRPRRAETARRGEAPGESDSVAAPELLT